MTITEIISRSKQGVTHPFLCRGDDDLLYYVKGHDAGCRTLCCEWVASRLGLLLGLPIPDIRIGDVPLELVRDSSRTDTAELGSGPVFASHFIEDAQEVTFADVKRIEPSLKSKVLLFDWWVRNEDRSLTDAGGNPNLLTSTCDGTLRVFDHNLAFDDTFNEARFWQSHVFNRAVSNWSDGFKREMVEQMRTALRSLPEIWQELPATWIHPDGDSRSPVALDLTLVRLILERFERSPDEFWTIRR